MAHMELLAPAGGYEALKAAVENGADAVYLGGKNFSARAGADNFDLEELARAVKYAHERQVKIYVTVNILVADREMPELQDYLFRLAQIGVDAVIVQDLGVAKMLKAILPEMEIHASTQMTANNSWAVRHLERLGFARVVLARENSAKEIQAIRKSTPLAIEIFVHGALCVCYSGQCLMSSFIGGRSGNRGRCAQPCRLTYELVDAQNRNVLQGEPLGDHLLSPRDLNLSEELTLLAASGVDSLKIEGRMKRPEYVATVTRVYRQALDGIEQGEGPAVLDERDRYELTQIFNRDFTTGYLHEHPGKDLMSFHRPNNRGTRLGRVVKVSDGYLTLRLEAPLSIGDGIEVWTSRGREGVTVDRIWSGSSPIEAAKSGETVRIRFPGRAHPGDRVFKTHDEQLMEKARQSFQEGREQRKRRLNLAVQGKVGERLALEARDGEKTVTVYSSTPLQQAIKRPLTEDYLRNQLGRLGTTPYVLGELVVELEGEGMIPVSELNEMRRQAVEALLVQAENRLQLTEKEYRERIEHWQWTLNAFKQELMAKQPGEAQRGSRTGGQAEHTLGLKEEKRAAQLSVAVGDLQALKAALKGGATRILFGGENWRSRPALKAPEIGEALELCRQHKVQGVWRLPRILNQSQAEQLAKRLRELAGWDNRPDLMVGNTATLEIVKEIDEDWPVMIDYSLNVFNQAAVAHFYALGAKGITLSPELNHEQLRLLGSWPNLEVMAFGDMEMMVSEYCPVGATLGGKKGDRCSAPCVKQPYFLKDRMNYLFPIETDRECRMHLFNSKRLNLIEELPALAAMGIGTIRLQLIRSEPQAVTEITKTFRRVWEAAHAQDISEALLAREKQVLEELYPNGYTKGHFFRGVL